MSRRRGRRTRSRRDDLWGGILLAGFGVFLLLVQFDMVPLFSLRNWWPLWPMGIGLWKLSRWDDPGELGSGVTLALIGVWLLMANSGWYGLTWRNSWPLALIAVGAGIVVKALAVQFLPPPEPVAEGADADAQREPEARHE